MKRGPDSGVKTRISERILNSGPSVRRFGEAVHHVANKEGARTDKTSCLVGTLGGGVRFEPRPEQIPVPSWDFRSHQPPYKPELGGELFAFPASVSLVNTSRLRTSTSDPSPPKLPLIYLFVAKFEVDRSRRPRGNGRWMRLLSFPFQIQNTHLSAQLPIKYFFLSAEFVLRQTCVCARVNNGWYHPLPRRRPQPRRPLPFPRPLPRWLLGCRPRPQPRDPRRSRQLSRARDAHRGGPRVGGPSLYRGHWWVCYMFVLYIIFLFPHPLNEPFIG